MIFPGGAWFMQKLLFAAVLCGVCLLSGCVERALVITSDPPGADVTVNQQWTGKTPYVLPFKHYGVYDIWIEHPGFEENGRVVKFYPLHVGEPVKAPAYQYAGVDFVTEVVLPATLQDVHNLHYVLERVDQADDISDVLARAADLRAASRLRTEMRMERDIARGLYDADGAAGGDPVAAPADSYAEYDQVQDSPFDATPPDPMQMPYYDGF